MKMTSPVEWEGANCSDLPGDGFYPEKGTAQITARQAKKVCNGEDGKHEVCRWRAQCLEYALMRGERFGVWGGMSERDRYKEKKRRKEEYEASLAPVINIRTRQQEKPVTAKVERYAKKTAAARKTAAAPAPRKAVGMLGRFAETKKAQQTLLPMVQQHLLSQPQGVDRHHHLLHVSELAKSDFCPRAAYLRISAVRAGKSFTEETPHFSLDNVYEEGNQIHAKWQMWFWDIGTLWGKFYCTVCQNEWWTTSPKLCNLCSAPRAALRYDEVVLEDESNLIMGHADGEIRRDGAPAVLLEVKSIGEGTVRIESPKTMRDYTREVTDAEGKAYKFLDHKALFRDLRRPFPAHLRQGVIYLYLRQRMTELYDWPEVNKIVFIYEYKPTQAVKEFSIGPDKEWIAEVLETCKDVVYALETGEAPSCKNGRNKLCVKCKSFDDKDHNASEPTVEARRGNGARTSTRRAAVVDVAQETERRTRIARRPNRSGRQRADEPASAPHSLGGLLRGSVGDGGDRRARG
jgi:hypothetical protein